MSTGCPSQSGDSMYSPRRSEKCPETAHILIRDKTTLATPVPKKSGDCLMIGDLYSTACEMSRTGQEFMAVIPERPSLSVDTL